VVIPRIPYPERYPGLTWKIRTLWKAGYRKRLPVFHEVLFFHVVCGLRRPGRRPGDWAPLPAGPAAQASHLLFVELVSCWPTLDLSDPRDVEFDAAIERVDAVAFLKYVSQLGEAIAEHEWIVQQRID
jgi:hypothetical protein